MGVTGVMSDARRQGIQAYKGHSKYVRGRKIKVDIPQAEPSQELELTPEEPAREMQGEGEGEGEGEAPVEGEGAEAALNKPTPPAPEPDRQVVVIDGEALQFERSITWECMPQNLEVLVHDSYFAETQSFARRLTPEVQRELLLKDAVEKIWGEFDVNNSGALDREETKRFL